MITTGEASHMSHQAKGMTTVALHVLFEADGGKTNFTFSVVHQTEDYAKAQETMGFYNGRGSAFKRMETVITSLIKK
jgi:hypothetical protein